MLVQMAANGLNTGFKISGVPENGEQMVLSFSLVAMPGNRNNQLSVGLGVSSSSTDYFAGTSLAVAYYDGTDSGMKTFTDSGVLEDQSEGYNEAARNYIRIVATSNNYYFFFSRDGQTWSWLGDVGQNSAEDWTHIAIRSNSSYNGGVPDPIIAINWLRHVAYNGDHDPF